jgi:hypothetical protein
MTVREATALVLPYRVCAEHPKIRQRARELVPDLEIFDGSPEMSADWRDVFLQLVLGGKEK